METKRKNEDDDDDMCMYINMMYVHVYKYVRVCMRVSVCRRVSVCACVYNGLELHFKAAV